MAGDKRIRAVNASFKIYIGGFNTHGRLTPIQKSPKNDSRGSGSYLKVTPNNLRAKQAWTDDLGEMFRSDELSLGKLNDEGEIELVNAEAIAAARQSDDDHGVMNVKVYPATKAIKESLVPDPKMKSLVFVPMLTASDRSLVPAPAQEQMVYEMLCDAVKSSKTVLMGSAVVSRGKEHLFQLTNWKGHLVLVPLTYTNFINEYETRKPNITKDQRGIMKKLIGKLAGEFDSASFTDDTINKLKVAEMIKLGETTSEALLTPEKDAADEEELLASFAAAVDAL